MGNSVLPSQFFCKAKAILKNEVYYRKKKICPMRKQENYDESIREVQEKGKEEESGVKVDTDSSPGFIHLSPKVLMNVNITPCAK